MFWRRAWVCGLVLLCACSGKKKQSENSAHSEKAIAAVATGTLPSMRRKYWPCRAEAVGPQGRHSQTFNYEGAPTYCVHPADQWHPGCPTSSTLQAINNSVSRRFSYKYDGQNRLELVSQPNGTPFGPFTYKGMTMSETERYSRTGNQIEVIRMKGDRLRQRILVDKKDRPRQAFIMTSDGKRPATTRKWTYKGNRLVTMSQTIGKRQLVTKYIYDCGRGKRR